jgi:hypothetical protein
MAQTHTWFATADDLPLLLDWLREAQAEAVGMSTFPAELPTDGRELILHFPSIGPLEFWPEYIRLSDYPENSARWRQAVILSGRTDSHVRQVDADRSAAAGLLLPEFRDNNFWVAGSLWFPGSRLRKTFPELARLCSRFQRWVRRFPTVFDNTKGDDESSYSYQLCMSGIVQRVVAFPAAEALLRQGALMIDYMTSPKCYNDFKRRMELSGHYSPP